MAVKSAVGKAAATCKHPVWSELKERRGILYRPELSVLTGSVPAGILLAQVLYWCGPDKHGNSKLRVFRNGHLWVAKTQEEWQEETALGVKMLINAQARLKRLGVIEIERFRFNGLVVQHTRLNEKVLFDLLKNPPEPSDASTFEPLPEWGEPGSEKA